MVVSAPKRRVRTVQHRSEAGSWELVFGEPAAEISPYVLRYCGYRERTAGPLRRRELPAPMSVLIIDLGPTVRILDQSGQRVAACCPGGFAAGLDESYTLTETAGEQRGVQIDFSVAGAARMFPARDIAGRVVALDDLFGAETRRLAEAIEESPDWDARFALVDRFIAARIRSTPPPAGWLLWAWRRIEESGGLVPIESLAKEIGVSRKHLSVSFRDRLGMAPKPLARLVRFDRVMRLLRSGAYRDFTEVAIECGYFDQAHFIRDFRRFSGGTPSDYLRRRLADEGGVLG